MRQIDRITAMVCSVMGAAINYTGERPADVRSPFLGWEGADPFPRRRRTSRWGWKDGKRHD